MPPRSKAKSSSATVAAAAAAAAASSDESSDAKAPALPAGPIHCAGCGVECDPATLLQCPQCQEWRLQPPGGCYFCNQECFTASWAVHKQHHDVCVLPSVSESDLSWFRFTGELRPGLLSPKRVPPKSIARPEYAAHKKGASAAEVKAYQAYTIPVLADDELAHMRQLSRQGREVLNMAMERVAVGMKTDDIDRIVHTELVARGMYPSPLNYSQFPKSCCTSLNEIVCHGIPDSTVIKEGDILNLDVSAFDGRMHFDLSETFFVGRPREDGESLRLVFCAFESMVAGMAALKAGDLYKHPGQWIQKRAELDGFSCARGVVSHSVGSLFHAPPDIAHYFPNKSRGTIAAGHVVTMEPMVNAGRHDHVLWPDEWTVATADGKWSAQFENTCAIVANAAEFQRATGSFLPCEVLTSTSAPYLDKPFFLTQLERMGIAAPKSRLPELGLPEPVFGRPTAPSSAATSQKRDDGDDDESAGGDASSSSSKK